MGARYNKYGMEYGNGMASEDATGVDDVHVEVAPFTAEPKAQGVSNPIDSEGLLKHRVLCYRIM